MEVDIVCVVPATNIHVQPGIAASGVCISSPLPYVILMVESLGPGLPHVLYYLQLAGPLAVFGSDYFHYTQRPAQQKVTTLGSTLMIAKVTVGSRFL